MGEWMGSPRPYLKIGKILLMLGKKYPDCFHLWVKFLTQNTVLRVSLRKTSDSIYISKVSIDYVLTLSFQIFNYHIFHIMNNVPQKS